MRVFQRAATQRNATGALKMLDVKMTDQMTGHETAGPKRADMKLAQKVTGSTPGRGRY